MSGAALQGRAAIVTGAGQGIGRAVALAFAEAGAAVACFDINRDAATATARDIEKSGARGIGLSCDVTDEAAINAAVGQAISVLGPVRILLNSAAANDPNGDVMEIAPSDWDRVFAVNVKGAYLMSRAVLPSMIAAGGGSIIHIASQLGRVAAPRRAVYCSTKGAVVQLAKAMAVDHAKDNVRVNALSPGAVETDRLILRFGDMDTARQVSGPKHLVNRLGRPEEIAAAAVFLASDGASFMTGADMLVDGGYAAI